MIGVYAIRFIHSETQYDTKGSTNVFTVQLHLDNQSSTSKKKIKAEDDPDTEEAERTDNKIHQKVCKFCKGDVDAFICWTEQLNIAIKGKPYDTTKLEVVIVSAILYGGLTDTWNENITSVTSELVNKVKTDKAGVKTDYKATHEFSNKSFDICLTNLRDMFLTSSLQESSKAT